MRGKKIFAVLIAIVVVAAAAFGALAWRREIPAQQIATNFDPTLIAHGRALAALGNCIACHTVPGGKAFAGGLAVPTPFGTIYSTNITPDPETGIGTWTEAAFGRAMREGVDRKGRHLYPAFPYDHFTLVTDEDNSALYAFLMTREPVKSEPRANELVFPLQFRPFVAAWKLLFLSSGPFQPDLSRDETWNRGAYLARGLGHCGACHTPRNRLGAEDKARRFSGGEAEGWQAYAIDQSSHTPIPWDRESMAFYLRHGWHELHGVSRGPMAEVTGNLSALPDSDIDAIAAYVVDGMGAPDAERKAAADRLRREIGAGRGASSTENGTQVSAAPHEDMPGAAIYAAACATCHESGRPPPYGGLDFRLSTAVNAPNPQNIINVTLFGLPPADGEASPVMPSFAGALSDHQIADLLAYMRARFSGREPWQGVAEMARRTRSGEYKVLVRPAEGIERAPVNVGAED
ncbi:cytochrome c [Mesorhizobium sp. BAC0120]|uniref:c-type cytochrome n=1 Tax=Mesorhizobium sp. BAC0120 TaxID=3090670 RepID=UPI00298CCF4E|nr:cytochrome c [Mesorhizobium sp. BAC0120]MDW6023446.1 cytochrome c [Mesorhizobium sp. BAC0120]